MKTRYHLRKVLPLNIEGIPIIVSIQNYLENFVGGDAFLTQSNRKMKNKFIWLGTKPICWLDKQG